jgi:large subunit ribosomal protein L6
MSRIGILPIHLPENVTFSYKDSTVTIQGPKGTLESKIKFSGKIVNENNTIKLVSESSDKQNRALHGLARALIYNMVVGVTSGFRKTLKIVGVGYKAQLQGNSFTLNLGYSHPILFPIPEGITVEVPDPNTVIVSGIDKQLVGQVTADIRKFRPPEPYKGKGVMYEDETVKRKAGKAAVK